MKIYFSDDDRIEIEKIESKYYDKQAALMPVLWYSQEKFGCLSDEVLKLVALTLDLELSHVTGVVSFYTMFIKKPMGKHHIQVCTNVSCMLRGGNQVYQHVSNILEIGNNECASDGAFSLEEVECMGACGSAPVIAINEDYYENVDIDQVNKIIDSLR